jgi:hypothetical protein
MDKKEQIKDYAVKLFLQLEEAGVYLKQEEQQAFVDEYINREDSLEVIIDEMLKGAKELSKSHDQRNVPSSESLTNSQPEPVMQQDYGRKLTLQKPSGNGFANIVMIAVSVGAILGILMALAFLSIK